MLTTPFWRIAGVSVEGTSHQKNQSGCQDAHKYCRLSDEMIVLAVADGAGSAKQAAQGANTSVQVACEHLSVALAEEIPTSEAQWRALLEGLLETVHCVLAEMALSTPPFMSSEKQKASADPNCHILKIDDLATTLTVVVITPGWIASAQVGDGAVVCQVLGDGASEEVLTVLGPDHGEYINETVFVLSLAGAVCVLAPLTRTGYCTAD